MIELRRRGWGSRSSDPSLLFIAMCLYIPGVVRRRWGNLIVVVCAPVAALIGPWLVHVVRNRCRALRKYFSKDADEEKEALTNNEDEDRDELGRPRWGGPDNKKGPDESTTRLTLPGQDDPPARVDEPPVEVPLQGSSPEGRGGCAIA